MKFQEHVEHLFFESIVVAPLWNWI